MLTMPTAMAGRSTGDASNTGDSISNTDEDVSKAGEDVSETGEDVSETGEDVSEADEDVSEADEDAYKAEEDTARPTQLEEGQDRGGLASRCACYPSYYHSNILIVYFTDEQDRKVMREVPNIQRTFGDPRMPPPFPPFTCHPTFTMLITHLQVPTMTRSLPPHEDGRPAWPTAR
jgi:hypothetical protein